MVLEIAELFDTAADARLKYKTGHITREQAKEKIEPYLKAANKRGEEIAKRHGVHHVNIGFTSFIR